MKARRELKKPQGIAALQQGSVELGFKTTSKEKLAM